MTDLKPARQELLALAAAVRDDDWASRLDQAITAAAYNPDWSWARTGLEACRLIFRVDGDPRELLDAVRRPTARGPGADPDVVGHVLAEARAVMATSTGPIPQVTEGT